MDPAIRRWLLVLGVGLAMFPVLIIMDRSDEYDVDPQTSAGGMGWVNLDRLIFDSATPTPTPTSDDIQSTVQPPEEVIEQPPEPTPEPIQVTPAPTPVPFPIETDVEARFYAGWYDAGGANVKDDWAIWRMINCESTWNVHTPDSAYYGLAQFSEATWALVATITGLWDYWNPYHQGYNTATWAQVSTGGTQWPYCWWV